MDENLIWGRSGHLAKARDPWGLESNRFLTFSVTHSKAKYVMFLATLKIQT